MIRPDRKAVTNFRHRLKEQGLARLEVHVRKDDVALIRDVVRALTSSAQGQQTRALLREHFHAGGAKGLKALLAAAPLKDVDLTRDRDLGRDVDL